MQGDFVSNEYSKQEKNRVTGRGEPDFEGLIQKLRSQEPERPESREEPLEQPQVQKEPEAAPVSQEPAQKTAAVQPKAPERMQLDLTPKTEPAEAEDEPAELRAIRAELQAALDLWENSARRTELRQAETVQRQEEAEWEEFQEAEAISEQRQVSRKQFSFFQSAVGKLQEQKRTAEKRDMPEPKQPEPQPERPPVLEKPELKWAVQGEPEAVPAASEPLGPMPGQFGERQKEDFQSGRIITLNLKRRDKPERFEQPEIFSEELGEDGPDLLTDLMPPRAEEQKPPVDQPQEKTPPERQRQEAPEREEERPRKQTRPEQDENGTEMRRTEPPAPEWRPEAEPDIPPVEQKTEEWQEEPATRFMTLNLRRTDLQTGTAEPSKAFDQDEEENLEAMLEANARAARQRRAEAEARAAAERAAQVEAEAAPVREPAMPEPPEEAGPEFGEPQEEPERPEELETPEPSEPAPEASQPGEPEGDHREEEPEKEPEESEEMPEPEDEGCEDDDSPDEAELEAPERGPNVFQRMAAALVERLSRRAPEELEDAAFEEEKPGRRKKARPKPEKVVELPKEQPPSLIQKKLAEMDSWADEFADAMFRSDSEEAKEEEEAFRKAERLIPATDEEREPRRPLRKEKPVKEKKPVRRAPDTSPKELYRMFSGSYKTGRSRLPFQLAIALALLAVTALAGNEVPVIQVPVLAEHLKVTGIVLVLGLIGASVLGLDILLEGIVRLFRGRPGLNTLSSIGVFFTLIDGLWYATLGREGPLPFCGFAALSLWAVAWGSCKKKQGLRDTCEDAYCRSEFERLTMDPGKWDGKGAFLKEPGSVKGFGSQIQEPDGAERAYRYATPVMMLASLMFGIFSVIGQKNPQQLVWSWSVIFILATPLSATLAYGLPYSKLVRRLHRSGAILAGWEGADSMKGDVGIVLTDRDLFPEGAVQLNGIHNFGEVSLEKLTGCTASIIRAADVGLARIFDDQVRIQGGFYRRVDDLKCTDEGGYTGLIRGDQVIIGTADYLTMLGIEISPGHQVRNAVFCVINGRLQGIFALNYVLPRTVQPTLNALIGGRIHPILALRDFNLTPEMLQRRFKLPAERLQYPPVERRHEFSAKGQPHSGTLGALIFREGIVPYADAILGGRRLRTVVRINRALSVAASAVGALLGFYLTMMNAYASLSLANILFFLVMWLVPTLLVSNGVDKF